MSGLPARVEASTRKKGRAPSLAAVFRPWHGLHAPCRFSIVSGPPCDLGILWSASVDGAVPQSLQMGSRDITALRSLRHCQP